MKYDVIVEMVHELCGSIEPVGESNTDAHRHENLRRLINVTDCLVMDIKRLADSPKTGMYSVDEATETAKRFMHRLTRKAD